MMCGSPVVDAVVRGVLPTSLELKCSAPHLHRRNPITSEDFTDYFHDRIKILSTGGTTYRCAVQFLCHIACLGSFSVYNLVFWI